MDLSGLHPRLRDATITIACDVDNPLTGPLGTAAVYAPQKGASADDVMVLERAMTCWAEALADAVGGDHSAKPGTGAAGGLGLAGLAVLNGTRPGIDLVLDLVGFSERLHGARLVVTGEGSLDGQSLRGKAPVGVAGRASAAGVPTVVVCGRSSLSAEQAYAAGFEAVYALSDLEPDPVRSMTRAEELLAQLGQRVMEQHLASSAVNETGGFW